MASEDTRLVVACGARCLKAPLLCLFPWPVLVNGIDLLQRCALGHPRICPVMGRRAASIFRRAC